MLDVSLLGTGGMMPLPHRHLTSLLLRLNGRMMLIDCGEGTQVTMKQQGWGFKNLDAICFTHYHADHVAGLPGLLLTVNTTERTEPITFIGPPDLERVVRSVCVIASEVNFGFNFIELPFRQHGEINVPNTEYVLGALPVEHSGHCFAYRVEARRKGKFDLARAEALGLPKRYWSILQRGEHVEHGGRAYTPDMVLGDERKGIMVSYCTDARPSRAIPKFINGSDIFICEGLHGDEGMRQKTASHKHMVYSEAAALAKAGNVGRLWLSHFSPAMLNPMEHIDNARNVFKNTTAGWDRLSDTLYFEGD
jgi:ribonuclease Z